MRRFSVCLLLVACAPNVGTNEDSDALCQRVASRCSRGESLDSCCTNGECYWITAEGDWFDDPHAAWEYCAPTSTGDEVSLDPSAPQDQPEETRTEAPPEMIMEPPDPTMEAQTPPPPPPDESGSSGSSSQSEACWGSPISCGARYTAGSCEQDWAGCHWEESYCGGAAYSCGYFTTASGCNTQGGCSWSYYYNDCRGGSWACHQQPYRGACYDQFGCYWVEGGCFGSAGSCANQHSPSGCDGIAGCYWQ